MRFFDGTPHNAPNKRVNSALSKPSASSPALRFEDVYRAERDYLWRTLRRLGVSERHLEDVAHDVLVVVHRKLLDYDPTRPLRPWLFGIATRVASDFRRRASNVYETPREDVEGIVEDIQTDAPDRMLEDAQRRALVYRALDALDEDKRAVFILHEIDNETIPIVAEALGIPLNTAYSRLRVAREEFALQIRRIEAGSRGQR